MECIICDNQSDIRNAVYVNGALTSHRNNWYKISGHEFEFGIHWVCFNCLESLTISHFYCYCDICENEYISKPTDDIIKQYHARDYVPLDIEIQVSGITGYDAVITKDGIQPYYGSTFCHSLLPFIKGRPHYLPIDKKICDACIKQLIYENICTATRFFQHLPCHCKLCRLYELKLKPSKMRIKSGTLTKKAK